MRYTLTWNCYKKAVPCFHTFAELYIYISVAFHISITYSSVWQLYNSAAMFQGKQLEWKRLAFPTIFGYCTTLILYYFRNSIFVWYLLIKIWLHWEGHHHCHAIYRHDVSTCHTFWAPHFFVHNKGSANHWKK